MAGLLQPKEVQITDQNGVERTFILSKFTAIAGREIIAKYPVSNLPKLGDYPTSEETMYKLMKFVGIDLNGTVQALITPALIDNHCSDWEVLTQVERAMLAYNCSFFSNGKGLISLAELVQKGVQKISEMSMASLAQLLRQSKQPSPNSEQSTV